LGDKSISKATNVPQIESDLIWYEEFLDYKIVIGTTILIKKQSKNKQICGGHSASIITQMILLHKNYGKCRYGSRLS
jgi:glutamate-5-semialdehyde dehydrogenase